MAVDLSNFIRNQWRNKTTGPELRDWTKTKLISVYSKLDDAAKKTKALIQGKSYGEDALRRATSTFARYASLRTPPNAGSDKMYNSQAEFEKLFYRPILWLPKLVRGGIKGFPPTGEDIDALRNGFKYKVVSTKDGKSKLRCYTKTKEEALQQARIEYRGVTRAAWGMNIQMVGAKPINQISKVLQDSPDITSQKNLNDVYFENQGEIKYILLHNRSTGIKAAYKKYIANTVSKYVRRTLAKYAEGESKRLINNALKDAKLELIGVKNRLVDMFQSKTRRNT